MENKKKYWNKNTNIQKRNEELKEMLQGFLIFTDKNKEKKATNDAFKILNEITEELYPVLFVEESEDKKEENPEGTEEPKKETNLNQLESELKQLKNSKKFFFRFETHCTGVIFIKIAKEFSEVISPKELIKHLFKQIQETHQSPSKMISKFLPIEMAFKAKFEIFKEKMKELVSKNFTDDLLKDKPKVSWKLELRVRNNNSINKKDYMDYVISLVDRDKFYVDYKTPELTVLVEITNDLCCISVLDNYSEYKTYNIQSMCRTEEERNKERERLIKAQKEKEEEKIKKQKIKEEKDDVLSENNDDEINII